MKKFIVLSIFSVAVLITASLVLPTQTTASKGNDNQADTPINLPDSVLSIFQNSCMDCHDNDGSSMAKSKLNFSKWNSYDADKQMKKAKQISKELKDQGMPPKKWRANNPDRIPNQAQTATVINWANSLQK